MHAYVELALCWNLAVASTAGVTLYRNNGQTVASVLAYTLEGSEQTVINLALKVGGL